MLTLPVRPAVELGGGVFWLAALSDGPVGFEELLHAETARNPASRNTT
jgi:hypothetical protein